MPEYTLQLLQRAPKANLPRTYIDTLHLPFLTIRFDRRVCAYVCEPNHRDKLYHKRSYPLSSRLTVLEPSIKTDTTPPPFAPPKNNPRDFAQSDVTFLSAVKLVDGIVTMRVSPFPRVETSFSKEVALFAALTTMFPGVTEHEYLRERYDSKEL